MKILILGLLCALSGARGSKQGDRRTGNHCFIPDENKTIKVGKRLQANNDDLNCGYYTCYSPDTLIITVCGEKKHSPDAKKVQDLGAPYPECCPKFVEPKGKKHHG